MSEDQQQRSIARRAAEEVAWNVARRAAAAKGGAVIAPVVIVAVVAVLMLALACGVTGAIFQSSSAPWPAPVATDTAGNYRAAGWVVTSRFGWRAHPLTPGVAEFHDGVDLAGPAFCQRCPVVSLFDARVLYVGWDDPAAPAPETAGGGQVVVIESGDEDYQVLYAHLEPYRLYVQLQGRIDDPYGRFDDVADYAPVGTGDLQPDGEIAIVCEGEMPTFRATRLGPGTVQFLYDRPAACRTRVTWGERGGGWRGWLPDGPTELGWRTPLVRGRQAGDVALRFRAHLVPPPPPPTRSPAATATVEAMRGQQGGGGRGQGRPVPADGSLGRCAAIGGGGQCVWALADIPAKVPIAARGNGAWVGSAPRVAQADPPQTPSPTPTATSHAAVAPDDPMPSLMLIPSTRSVQPGDSFAYTVAVLSDSVAGQRVRVTATLDPRLELAGVSTDASACEEAGGSVTCEVVVQRGGMAQLRIDVRVRPDAPVAGAIVARLTGAAGRRTASVDPVFVTLQAPPPAAVPSLTPTRPAAAPPASHGAPCHQAVIAALSRQGARYSQGGALDADPRGSDGLPLPRTGPDSFDCSGLVWWAYAQAGIAVGGNTAQQVGDGVAVPCTLDDLRGQATRCWAPGDLIFLRYPGGRHVAIYAGQGLFMDCFNHRVGCVLHDVSQDPFYRAHFWQARRVVEGCQGMTLDPGAPVPAPLDGTPEGDAAAMCVAEPPSFSAPVEELRGCGPPVRPGDRVYQLDSTVGFVGMTGVTTGPHLHLGLRVRSYDGTFRQTHVCGAEWLRGRVPPPGASCWTDMADPLDFMPRSLGGEVVVDGTPIAAGAPYQLPPPGHPGSLATTPAPGATPVGQYWSPHADGGRYGGGSALDWLRDSICAIWEGAPLCS